MSVEDMSGMEALIKTMEGNEGGTEINMDASVQNMPNQNNRSSTNEERPLGAIGAVGHNLMGKQGSLLGGEDPDNPMLSNGTVPEKYEFMPPKGMNLSSAERQSFEKQARELHLSNAQAQHLLQLAHQNQETHKNAYYRQIRAWKDEVRNDSEMGGAALRGTVAYAQAGLNKFDPDKKIFGLLQETGYANHPAVIRFLAAVGRAHREDYTLLGSYDRSSRPLHERLYGKD